MDVLAGGTAFHLAVDFFSVPDVKHEDYKPLVLESTNRAIVTDAVSPEFAPVAFSAPCPGIAGLRL